MSGVNIVGVQFRRAGKIYDFDGHELLLKLGDKVVVETERGLSLAEVKRVAFAMGHERDMSALKPVIRLASDKDLESEGRLTPEYAKSFAKEKITGLKLDMHVINVEVQFGGNKVIIFFSAPGRVDFRELVKELAGGLKTRVELKQVGARDEAKLSGGLGICGREFCCSSFLREFVPVSIKMAKNQNLALNPSKVSGGCGRLLCCLTYEDETYSLLRKSLLPKGTRVKTDEGEFGDVIKGDILNQTMLIELDSGDQKSFPIDTLELVEAGKGESEDDWGDDIDLGELMSDDSEVPKAGGNEAADKRQTKQKNHPRDNQDPKRQRSKKPRTRRGPQKEGSWQKKPREGSENPPQKELGSAENENKPRNPQKKKRPRNRKPKEKPRG